MSMPEVDVAIVGGGINGVGIAQAAAAAGYRVALFEKDSLAAGTSSKSSKLIHGGLRYLERYEFGLVYESLMERRDLLRLAPELVQLRRFYIPVYGQTRRPPWLVRTGLSLYALFGGLRRETRFSSLPRNRWDSLDGLDPHGLRAVFCYQDAQTDDAGLTRAVWLSAERLGARLYLPARIVSVDLGNQACSIDYVMNGQEHTVTARAVVNAAGPWVNDVLANIRPMPNIQAIERIQGTHIEVSGLLANSIYYVEAPRDGRAVFVMPWRDRTLVGTTETRFTGDNDQVTALNSECRYLLRVLRRYFPRYHDSTVLDSWAGLRVLPAGKGHAFHRSRETILATDRRRRTRLVSIYGGKLTTFRSTARKVLRLLRPGLPDRRAVADTASLPLEPAS